jgi:hypothetical protein
LHFSLTQPRVLVRFQGNNGHPTDFSRIQEWAKRLQKWKAHALAEIYFFTHQPGDAEIPETARVAVREIVGNEIPRQPPPAEQMALLD